MTELLAAAALGFAGGAVAGMLGVGGGILFVPALAIVLDEPQLRADSPKMRALAKHPAVSLTIGALSPVGVLLGVMVSNAVSQRTLEVSFAILLLLVAAQLTHRARGRP